jgi:hypothetical protein
VLEQYAKKAMESLAKSIDMEIMRGIHTEQTKKENRMEKIINEIDLISLNIRLWQGDKTLTEADLASNGIDVSKLPPGKLASLGCKRTISRSATRDFTALKREAHSVCSQYGLKFGEAGYAIPVGRTNEVCYQLALIKDRFNVAKNNFQTAYDNETDAWIAAQPDEWKEVIRQCVDPIGKVLSQLQFNFSAFKVVPATVGVNGLEEEANGLYAQLCKDIRSAASIAYKTSYEGRSAIGKRALRPLKAIVSKLESLKFLDDESGKIQAFISNIDQVIANAAHDIKRSTTCECTGLNLSAIKGLLTDLSSFGIRTEIEPQVETSEEYCEIDDSSSEELGDSCGIDAPAITLKVPKLDWDF